MYYNTKQQIQQDLKHQCLSKTASTPAKYCCRSDVCIYRVQCVIFKMFLDLLYAFNFNGHLTKTVIYIIDMIWIYLVYSCHASIYSPRQVRNELQVSCTFKPTRYCILYTNQP